MRARTAGIPLLLLIGCTAVTRAFAGITASLNSSRVASGDTVQLTLVHDGRTSGQPDLAPLRRDFDILGTSSGTTYELINGSASEKSEVVLTLAPKVTGRLSIPPLSWDGERSPSLALTVVGPGGAGQGGQTAAAGAPAAAKVFIESTAEPGRPYVEAAVHLTVRLFTSEPLYHADLELPDDSNVVVKQVGSDEVGHVERDSHSYQVVTRHYLLFPLHSGKLSLKGPVLDAEVAVRQSPSPFGNNPFGGFFSGFFRTVQPVRVHGDRIVLSVRPRPAGAGGRYWLPARHVTLTAAWSPAKLTAHAGDPVTLDLDLRATGLTAAQLPDIASQLSVPSGLRAYPDQARLHDSTRNGELVGSRDQTIALLADSPGHYTIPALRVTWWDTKDNQPRTAALPARTITILPAPAGTAPVSTAAGAPAAAAAPTGPSTHPKTTPTASRHPAAAARKSPPAPAASDWEWISIGLAAAWLATLCAWLWSRRSRHAPPPNSGNAVRSPPPPPSPRHVPLDSAKERAAFRAACEANDAPAARAHLLAWTASVWGATPSGINAIAARISDAALVELLRDLDRACYAGGAWQGQALAAALPRLPTRPGKAAGERAGLAPLYPESPGSSRMSRDAPADRIASKRRR